MCLRMNGLLIIHSIMAEQVVRQATIETSLKKEDITVRAPVDTVVERIESASP